MASNKWPCVPSPERYKFTQFNRRSFSCTQPVKHNQKHNPTCFHQKMSNISPTLFTRPLFKPLRVPGWSKKMPRNARQHTCFFLSISDTMVPHSCHIYIFNNEYVHVLVFYTQCTTLFSAKLSPIRSRYRVNIFLWIKNAYRTNRNIGNARAKARDTDDNDNGKHMFDMSQSCTIIAPRNLYNPLGKSLGVGESQGCPLLCCLIWKEKWSVGRCWRFWLF